MEILAQRRRPLGRHRDHLGGTPLPVDRRAVDERPEVTDRIVELEPRSGVADRRIDLRPVAHDSGIGETAVDVVVAEPEGIEAFGKGIASQGLL